jgi:acetoacetate decarboxylase
MPENPKMLQGYSMPMDYPLYVAPPYHLRNTRGITILFRTKPKVLEELVPQPLVPNPENLVIFYIGRFNVEAPITIVYHEAGIGVPVSFRDTFGQYAAYLYLDKVLPIVAGREIWGFPKKEADIAFIEERGKISAEVVQDGNTIIEATLQLRDRVDPIPSQPNKPWFNLKLIPSVKENAPPDVMQLTSVMIESRPKELHRGQATLELNSSPSDSLGKLPIVEILSGDYAVRDSVLGHGDVVFDYLADA